MSSNQLHNSIGETPIISPSILSADLLNLGREVASVEEAGAQWHHVDVMDGHFVDNLSFGLPVIKSLAKVTKLPLDVHIMIDNPDKTALEYVAAGADFLTFHIEASSDPRELCRKIRAAGARSGVALKPKTTLDELSELLPDLDLILVMGVEPGFGGQNMLDGTVEKVAAIRQLVPNTGGRPLISVDGGVTSENSGQLLAAGADVLVAGSAVYRSADRAESILALKQR